MFLLWLLALLIVFVCECVSSLFSDFFLCIVVCLCRIMRVLCCMLLTVVGLLVLCCLVLL